MWSEGVYDVHDWAEMCGEKREKTEHARDSRSYLGSLQMAP
jgi:hypothetical protein